jgi:hypothetical protein
MKVLFAVSHPGFLRNFESGLRHLLRRGHAVHVLLGKKADADSVTGSALQVLTRIEADGTLTSSVSAPLVNDWTALGDRLRMARDFWRYLQPAYDDAVLLRERARSETPAFAAALAERGVTRAPVVGTLVDRAVHAVERRLPLPPQAFVPLDEHRPDVLVVTPLIYFGSDQVLLLRAARERGVPVVYAAGSWDHLTTKGLVHEEPDLTLVWNEAQIEEAARFHGVRRERCRATGAQAFDHWFEQRPLLDKRAFCRLVGLPHDRPMLLYLCSSTFIAGDERAFVGRWLAAVRAAGEPVAGAGVLIRPHPQNAGQWHQWQAPDALTQVWPREGANPVSDAARADFFHSICYSDAVVGVNTSAQIESAIAGKPVFSILSEQYAGTQSGTLHFRHLRDAGGGLLHMSPSLEAHVAQLAEVLASSRGSDERARRFVDVFVRPGGADRPAGDVFAAAVETAAPSVPRRSPDWIDRWIVPRLARLAASAAAATNLRAVRAPVDYQRWFLPARRRFVPGHMRDAGLTRVVWVAATAPEVERVSALTSIFAGTGGRTLLCVPDGSAAGAAAKRLAERLERCTTVALVADEAALGLLFAKFRADVVAVFDIDRAHPSLAVVDRAATAAEIPFVVVAAGMETGAVIATLAADRHGTP